MNKKKTIGQVYTPINVVKDILKLVNYHGEIILNKHIIDNSCGNGAFLCEIVKRYIKEYKHKNNTTNGLAKHLSKYIHGLEIDEKTCNECIKNLNYLASLYGIENVKWDIKCADTLYVDTYNGKMDYVVGNPPYVRIHNLQSQYKKVKTFEFSKLGMTDLYIVFFEIGFNMLNKNGKMCYITPNSFYNSIAGRKLREYIDNNKTLYSIMDLGHYQPFNASTYTTITAFENGKKFESIKYYKYNLDGKYKFINKLKYNNFIIDGKFILIDEKYRNTFNNIFNVNISNKNINVKNAFATLADNIFISNDFNFNECIINTLKASTGEWKKCIFPYDDNLKPIKLEDITDKNLVKYFNKNKEKLCNRSIERNVPWNCFGRNQAISDVYKEKIAINTTIKDINSIKLNYVHSGDGVYSGLYIISDYGYELIEKSIKSQEFVDYVKALNKCKSGGYFTFSSNDLKKYLVYKLEGC